MKSVTSGDGTLIAYEQGGRGPHLVLVHGISGNSSVWEAVRPRLEEHFTVARMDRRGRGGSGDSTEYSIEREFEDVASVVNALDAPVLLFGHSYGAICALEAATRTDKLSGLVLYEPRFGGREPDRPSCGSVLRSFWQPVIARGSPPRRRRKGPIE
jgi:pimeloyl-ACP methyl ester carboxylesterase